MTNKESKTNIMSAKLLSYLHEQISEYVDETIESQPQNNFHIIFI